MNTEHPPGFREYERRFLVEDDTILGGHPYDMIGQAYLFTRGGWTIRVRRTFYRASDVPVEGRPPEGPLMLAIKGPRREASRREEEWEIPRDTALALFALSDMKVFKARYSIVDAETNTTWVVDRFEIENKGLIIAECEMHSVTDLQALTPPAWCGKEVTDNPRYNNEELARHPYSLWRYLYGPDS